jgi:Zn-dependent peptidase ImmA (M78 family)
MEETSFQPRIGSARTIARKLHKDLGVKFFPLKINDVYLLLRQRDSDLYIEAWKLKDDVDGMQVADGDSSYIAYNDSRHPHRKRFTVAHEIGHYLMGHTIRTDFYSLDETDHPEIEANAFAAELLVPLSELKKDLLAKKDPNTLYRKYGVSNEVVWRQIQNHKLTKIL